MTETVVRSVRMSAELWAFVAARAKARGVNVNAWMVRCVEDARKRLEAEPPKTTKSPAKPTDTQKPSGWDPETGKPIYR